MGLRLVAHYYDRMEALIVSATLDAAGVPNWVENYWQNVLQPLHEISLGGYRLMVCEQDLNTALAVLSEAERNRSFEGERLVKNYHFGFTLVVLFATLGIIYLPLVSYAWRDVGRD